jgi:hypothetical protein
MLSDIGLLRLVFGLFRPNPQVAAGDIPADHVHVAAGYRAGSGYLDGRSAGSVENEAGSSA